MADDWITTRESVKISGYHVERIRELVREGRVKGRKIVTVWLVSKSSLSRYLRKQADRGEKRGRKSRY